MLARRRLWLARPVCSLAAGGLRQSGPLLSKGTSVGTLKTSLSHMEYENQQLRREVASLKAEDRQTEDRLVQEESANGDLSARLDNAMAMLKRQGLDGGEMADTGADDPAPSGPDDAPRRPFHPEAAQAAVRPDPRPDRRPARRPDEGDTSSNGWGRRPRGPRATRAAGRPRRPGRLAPGRPRGDATRRPTSTVD